jgi:hypothetical protein
MRQKLKKNQKPPKRRSLRSKNRIKKLRQNLIKLWLSIRPLNQRQLRNLEENLKSDKDVANKEDTQQ